MEDDSDDLVNNIDANNQNNSAEPDALEEGEEQQFNNDNNNDNDNDNVNDDNESGDDSDDDVEIVMDTEQQSRSAPQPITIKPIASTDASGNQTLAATSAAAKAATTGLDISLVGQIDGKDLFDVDVDSIEDKPWRKPGADITDYFNFGFNEVSWRAYCNKQKSLREEALMQKRIHVFEHSDLNTDQQMLGMFGMQQPKFQRMAPQQQQQQQQFNPMMMQMQMMQQQQMMQQRAIMSGNMMGAPPGLPGMGAPPGLPMMSSGQSSQLPPPGTDLNMFGKRTRDQDESAIKVIAGGENLEDKPPGTEGGSRSESNTPRHDSRGLPDPPGHSSGSGNNGRFPNNSGGGGVGGNFQTQQNGFNQQNQPPFRQHGQQPPRNMPPVRGRGGGMYGGDRDRQEGYRGGPPPQGGRDGYYERGSGRDHYRDDGRGLPPPHWDDRRDWDDQRWGGGGSGGPPAPNRDPRDSRKRDDRR